jgi:uncharacterized protein YndB with AHSA1/START domain
MNPKAQHTTFVIEKDLPGSTRHAFRFWSEFDFKRKWTSCHTDWTVLEDTFDFRSGGSEVTRWRMPEGQVFGFRAHYFQIVPAARIIYAYEMTLGRTTVSTSLATVEFAVQGGVTKMTFTEQAAFLDGSDPAIRSSGTEMGFDRLVAVMEQELARVH